MIVLTGATGNTGSVVAADLKRRGVPFVAMARSDENRRRLAEAGIDSVHGDFDAPETLVPALRGADAAYLVSTPDEHLVRREIAFIDAAKQAGVRRVVKCGAYASGLDAPTKNLRSHGQIEAHLAASGMEWTALRPHGYMQTFTLLGWDLVQKAGALVFAAGDGGLPLVDVRDVAAVAVKALTEDGHHGRAYDVTGPEVLTFHDVAATLERVLGRPVTYLPGSERALDLMLSMMGATETPREHAIVITRMIREHAFERVHPTQQELGLHATTYEEFVRDLVAGRTGGGNSFRPPDTWSFRAIGAVMPWILRARFALAGRPARGAA